MLNNLYISKPNKFEINKKSISSVIKHLKNDFGFKVSHLAINFITGDLIREINRTYLEHDFSTDILTFNYDGDKFMLDGEIYISIDDAKSNANDFNVSTKQEYLRLIIHGVLHLIGYDDTTEELQKAMKEKEDLLTAKYDYLLL